MQTPMNMQSATESSYEPIYGIVYYEDFDLIIDDDISDNEDSDDIVGDFIPLIYCPGAEEFEETQA